MINNAMWMFLWNTCHRNYISICFVNPLLLQGLEIAGELSHERAVSPSFSIMGFFSVLGVTNYNYNYDYR